MLIEFLGEDYFELSGYDQIAIIKGYTMGLDIPDCTLAQANPDEGQLRANLVTGGVSYFLVLNGYCANPEAALEVARQMYEAYDY